MNPLRHLIAATSIVWMMIAPVSADEREVTDEQRAAVAHGGDAPEEQSAQATAHLPDLTKGDRILDAKPEVWHLGPTGVVATLVGGFQGKQLQVQRTLPGSPAAGKFLPGDVITGINGKPFTAGEHLGIRIGNSIIEAELEKNAGKISFQIWRDKNFTARSGGKNIAGTDVDALISQVANDDSLYDWKKEEEKKAEVAKVNLDAFPIDPVTLDVELTLRVMPPYSDSSPFDCPKTTQILEDAWKVLEKRFETHPQNPRSGKASTIEAMALIASGKPEHRKIVHDWVRSKNSPWGPPEQPPGTMFEPGYKGHKGYQSWHHGFIGLNCALYYEATGDDYVLPALRKFAIDTAMGQSGGGSWGHTFAFPSFNGGELHRMNPGYGALNAAGNRCFFLIALAKKLGIEHPEIDAAIARSQRFFGSYVDQGAIPYGDHAAAGTDDSNGKNSGVAFAMKLLGDSYAAKYFAQMSTHSAFTRRGGHGHDYHGTWSGWAASLCGPESVAVTERNMRWRRTLCRLHDGSFVYHSPTNGKYNTLRDPTATEVLHYAQGLGQTLITGKDPDKALWNTERDLKQLLASARPQFNDDSLTQRAGKPWQEWSTDEVFDLLDVFIPRTRSAVAQELGRRFTAGEKDIAPRLITLLTHESARFREGAVLGLSACGADLVLGSLSQITKLLDDSHEFVRISAATVIGSAANDGDSQIALLQAAAADPKAQAPNTLRNKIQGTLFGSESKLALTPFDAGIDPTLVEHALESLLLLDPVSDGAFLKSRIGKWDKETVLHIAGPLTYIAENEQNNDQMFAARSLPARAMLAKLGYREAAEASSDLLRRLAELPRSTRSQVGFKRALIDPLDFKAQPAAFIDLLPALKAVLTVDPLIIVTAKDERTQSIPVSMPLKSIYDQLLTTQAAAKSPSIADDVRAHFEKQVTAATGTAAKIKICRDTLADPQRKNRFEKIAAMDWLTELVETEAIEDLAAFLGHSDWRLRDHSRKLAATLARNGGAAPWLSILASTQDPNTAAGILAVLASAQARSALEPATAAMHHPSPVIRQQAIQTVATIGGETSLPTLIAHLKQATDPADVVGCENALDGFTTVPASAAKLREPLLALLPDAHATTRDSIHYLLSRIGDAPSLAALKKAAESKDPAICSSAILALSYSPSRDADPILIDLASSDKQRASIVGSHAVRRMAIGPKGFGDIPTAQSVALADSFLKYQISTPIVRYLALIPDARALNSLLFCLKKGETQAAESLITCAEGLDQLSATDAKIATTALQGVIEYIEVTRLRGGIKAHMNKEDNYATWQTLQARAGKALLKFHKPESAPLPGFDPLELDP